MPITKFFFFQKSSSTGVTLVKRTEDLICSKVKITLKERISISNFRMNVMVTMMMKST